MSVNRIYLANNDTSVIVVNKNKFNQKFAFFVIIYYSYIEESAFLYYFEKVFDRFMVYLSLTE